ncbi:hypothetical protein TWF569_003430 [Orbilia oligospora]|nr:hypothetical protein TWF594_007700 [Orbilia oligospora]KAF3151711.1 hypothetical protein TWF569_003430 [Orbilia oligospora]
MSISQYPLSIPLLPFAHHQHHKIAYHRQFSSISRHHHDDEKKPSATSLVAVSLTVAVSSSSLSPSSSLTLQELLEKRLTKYLKETKMASKQPDESSFAPASLGFGQRTDFEETDASQNTFANNVDKHVGGPGILGTEEDIKRHEEVVSQLTKSAGPHFGQDWPHLRLHWRRATQGRGLLWGDASKGPKGLGP